MNKVPARSTKVPSTGQRRTSALEMKRQGWLALMIKMSSHEMWLQITNNGPPEGGSQSTCSRTPMIANACCVQLRTVAWRSGAPSLGKRYCSRYKAQTIWLSSRSNRPMARIRFMF